MRRLKCEFSHFICSFICVKSFTFRELGRVMRTIFLLRYISDPELRSTIHAATNKSGQFNNFAKWSFFGNEGIIAENLRQEQRKIVTTILSRT